MSCDTALWGTYRRALRQAAQDKLNRRWSVYLRAMPTPLVIGTFNVDAEIAAALKRIELFAARSIGQKLRFERQREAKSMTPIVGLDDPVGHKRFARTTYAALTDAIARGAYPSPPVAAIARSLYGGRLMVPAASEGVIQPEGK